jgi:hypothetical protein
VSLHLRLSADTTGFVHREHLELMKPGAILINTARGAIVKESDLVQALLSHRIAGAGLDVFKTEPLPPGSPLSTMRHVVLTPHAAGITPETTEAGLALAIENVPFIPCGRSKKTWWSRSSMPTSHHAIVTAEGHLVDSQLLKSIFDRVIERGAGFEVQHFELGRTNDDFSKLTLKITAADPATLVGLLEDLIPFGCHAVGEQDALLRAVDRDGCAPEDFYSSTNQRTQLRAGGKWIDVDRQRNGRGDCRERRLRRVPQAARAASRRSGRVRPRRTARHAGIPRSRAQRFLVHEQ